MSPPSDPPAREAPAAAEATPAQPPPAAPDSVAPPEAEAPGARAARARRLVRAAVALGCARLRSSPGGRFGVAAGAGLTLLYGVMAITLRLEDGAGAPLDGLLQSAARWLAWLAAGPIALAAAHDRGGADRRDGIEALAASRGLSVGSLHGVRTLSAMSEVARAIATPSLVLAVVAALLAGSVAVAARHLAVGVAMAAFALVCGATLGGLAAASGRVAGARGRTLFALIILAPWALADIAGNAVWSIPGALGAFLQLAARAAGGAA